MILRPVRAQLVRVVEVGRQDRDDHLLPKVVRDQRLGAFRVLRGDQHALDPHGPAVAVADGDLGLPVGTQVVQRAVLADLGQALREPVRERDRQRHELLGLARGVAEHHALVAGAGDVELVLVGGVDAGLVGVVHALRDVGRLLVDRVDDGAGVGGEAEVGVDVADLADRLARDVLDVDEGRRGDLTRDDDEARVDERLAGHATHRVVPHDGVEDTIGDLVGDLVRVALRDGLGREQVLVVSEVGHGISRNSSAVVSVGSLSSSFTTAPALPIRPRSSRAAGEERARRPVRSPSVRS
jgi:hypothetical protein